MSRKEILEGIQTKIQDSLAYIETELLMLVNDLSNETKSSAGDKFETSREMIQQERVKLEHSKAQKLEQLSVLNRFDPERSNAKIGAGSIIETSNGMFILGIAVGKVDMTGQKTIFGLGLNSPLAQQFLNKKINEIVELQGIRYTIDSVY